MLTAELYMFSDSANKIHTSPNHVHWYFHAIAFRV